MALLHLDGVTAYYGHLQALHELSLQVDAGEILAVIGANGAGKSTMLSLISGELRPREGRVYLNDVDITRIAPTNGFDEVLRSFPKDDTCSARSLSKTTCSVAPPPNDPAPGTSTPSTNYFPSSRPDANTGPRCCQAASSRPSPLDEHSCPTLRCSCSMK